MIFNGDLGKYPSAGAIMFLYLFGLNGILSIADNLRLVSFNTGQYF